MRTTVIPAQITTVEDKIAGNLNLTQILILMVPVFWSTLVYSVLSPKMGLAWYKLPLILIVLFACLVLSLRIKGKVVLSWLIVLLKFYLRPKVYLFNKNDTYLRDLDLPVFKKRELKLFKAKTNKNKSKKSELVFSFSDFVKFEHLLGNPKYSISFKSGRRSGLNVAFQKLGK